MAQEVAALIARLEADTRDFQKGLKAAETRLQRLEGEGKKTRKGLAKTDSSTKKLTASIKKFAIAAGVAFGAREVLNFAKSTITAASDLGESINAVEVTFEDAAEGIKKLGTEAATAVGLSNAEFNTLAVGFAAFVDKIAVGGDDVVGVMKELTGRAADFASVMNIDVAEAATIFRSGLAGETEPLRKFGIDLSAATVTAKALALGLAETSSALTEQDKIIARYSLLMEQTAKTQGDFANTSDQLANSQRIFTAELENTKARIGEALLPVMAEVLKVATDLLPAFEDWAKGIAKTVAGIAPLISGLGALIGKMTEVSSAASNAVDEQRNVFSGLGALLVEALTSAPIPFFIKQVERMKSVFDGTARGTQVFAKAMRLVGESTGGTTRQVKAFTDGLKGMSTFGGLTTDRLNELISATDFYDGQLEDTLGKTLEWAKATGQSAEAIAVLDEGLGAVIDSLGLTEEEVNALRKEFDLTSREIADADRVLLGYDRTSKDLEPPDRDIAKEFKKIKTESEKAAAGIKRVQTELRKVIDPAFALIDASFAYTDALAAQDEVLKDVESSERDRIKAGQDAITSFNDLLFAADAYAQELDTDVASALRFMRDQGIITNETLAIMLERLDEFDDFAGNASLELDYIERNRAALERFLAVNIGAGAPGVNIPLPIPSPADTKFFSAHSGGVVPGPPGVTVPILAQGGETVRTVSQERTLQGGGGVSVVVNGNVWGTDLEDHIVAALDRSSRRGRT